MRCNWQAYLNLIPPKFRLSVDRLGKGTLQELRLRLYQNPELISASGSQWLQFPVTKDDLTYCINAASRYSPWAAGTMAKGYITAVGGHRLGICGEATVLNGDIRGIGTVTSINLRVAQEITGIADSMKDLHGSVLIIGKPGSGKTTLLRDYIRVCSDLCRETVSVVDERMELFPQQNQQEHFSPGIRTDILSGCSKSFGIEAVLRNMNPDTIAVDEITAQEDCEALIHAGWCGVRLIATAHAGSRADLLSRQVYKPIVESRLFENLIVLHKDKSWNRERIDI